MGNMVAASEPSQGQPHGQDISEDSGQLCDKKQQLGMSTPVQQSSVNTSSAEIGANNIMLKIPSVNVFI